MIAAVVVMFVTVVIIFATVVVMFATVARLLLVALIYHDAAIPAHSLAKELHK